jgi:hypothetical protein
MKKYISSEIKFIKRVPKTLDNIYGIKVVNSVPITQPALFILGGNKTESEKNANNYILRISALLRENNIDNVNIYSVLYQFNSRDTYFDELNVFNRAKRKLCDLDKNLDNITIKTYEKEPEPLFIKKLYNLLIKPRIIDKNNKKFDIEQSIINIRKLQFFTHCYGSAVLKYLENFMRDNMLIIGYSDAEIQEIQKNLLVIAHTPMAPLEDSRFTTLSFVSAQDEVLDHRNLFCDYTRKSNQNMKPSFFSGNNGNVFMVKKSKTDEDAEHFTSGIPKSEENLLTDDGKIIFAAERNAIINGIKSSIKGEPLKSISELVSGDGVCFESLLVNGNIFYNEMLSNLRIMKQIPKHADQK